MNGRRLAVTKMKTRKANHCDSKEIKKMELSTCAYKKGMTLCQAEKIEEEIFPKIRAFF